jgi:chromate transporter
MQSRHQVPDQDLALWLLMVATILVMLKSKIHLLWLLAVGAVLGVLGWV